MRIAPTMKQIPFLHFALLAMMISVGCGKGEERVATHPVTAVLRMDGNPFGPCSVMLYPVGTGRSVAGPADADGKILFGTYENGDGAPVGEYKVVVRGSMTAAPPKPIPDIYSNPAQTKLRITITEGNNEFAVDLDSKIGKASKNAEGDPFTRAMESESFGAGATQENN